MKKYSAYPFLIWAFIFTVIPIGLIVYYSFFITVDGVTAFTLDGYQTFFEAAYLKIFVNSVIFALITTLVCLIIAYPLAYIIANKNEKTQRILLILLILPMWMNFLLRTYSWITILGNKGIINRILMFLGFEPVSLLFTNYSVLLGMIYNFLPFMVLPIYTALSKLDESVIEAAKDLGANDKQVFTKVIFPLSMPGIVSGITMVFMPTVSNFVIPSLLGGGRSILIGNIVEQQFRLLGDWNFGSAISVVLMIFILFSVAILRRYEESV